MRFKAGWRVDFATHGACSTDSAKLDTTDLGRKHETSYPFAFLTRWPRTLKILEARNGFWSSVISLCLFTANRNVGLGPKCIPQNAGMFFHRKSQQRIAGVNDMLPGMGFVYSKQPHSLALSDIHRAFLGTISSAVRFLSSRHLLQLLLFVASLPEMSSSKMRSEHKHIYPKHTGDYL